MACRLVGASHYLNQCWNIVNCAIRDKLQWQFHRIQIFSVNKMHLKISSTKWRPFCLGLKVLKYLSYDWEDALLSYEIINLPSNWRCTMCMIWSNQVGSIVVQISTSTPIHVRAWTRKPWWVVFTSKHQITILYRECWLSLFHWHESIFVITPYLYQISTKRYKT